MIQAEEVLVDGQGALEGGLGGGEVAQGPEDAAQVVDVGGDVGMIRAEDVLGDGQGSLEGGLGGSVGGPALEVKARLIEKAAGGLQT